jgi:hypothetical protein
MLQKLFSPFSWWSPNSSNQTNETNSAKKDEDNFEIENQKTINSNFSNAVIDASNRLEALKEVNGK